jgi:hypothetical protein
MPRKPTREAPRSSFTGKPREEVMSFLEPCSVELLETFGDDLTVVNAARVSFAKESKELTPADEKLIA